MKSKSRKPFSKLSEADKFLLKKLRVLYPKNEEQRILTLRQSKILNVEDINHHNYEDFDSFPSLASSLFNVPIATLSLIEIGEVHFISRYGNFSTIRQSRNSSIESYLTCISPELKEKYSNKLHTPENYFSSEKEIPPHLIIPDCSQDPKFSTFPYIKDNNIRFFASIALVVNNYVLGALTIMDTNPRYGGLKEGNLNDIDEGIVDLDSDFDWLNFIDLSVVASQLINEKIQAAISTDSQIASFVVNMMHDLRTPLTSIHYAIPLLSNDLKSMQFENLDSNSLVKMEEGTTTQTVSTNNFESVMKCFEMSYNEIDHALYDLTSLVDVGEIWAQIIVKYAQFLKEANYYNNPNGESNESAKFFMNNYNESNINDIKVNSDTEIDVESSIPSILPRVNIVEYINDIFLTKLELKKLKIPLEIKWIIDTSFLSKGINLVFADIIFALIISSISKVTNIASDLTFIFLFDPSLETEYYIEGNIILKMYSKTMNLIDPTDFSNHITSTVFLDKLNETKSSKTISEKTSEMQIEDSTKVKDLPGDDVNFLSVNSILRAANVFCNDYEENIQEWFKEKYSSIDWTKANFNKQFIDLGEVEKDKSFKIVEYLIPCTVLFDKDKKFPENTEIVQDYLYFKKYQTSVESLVTFETELIPSSSRFQSENEIENISTVQYITKKESSEKEKTKNPETKPSEDIEKKNVEIKSGNLNDNAISTDVNEFLRILIVEDVDSVRKLLARWLSSQGCLVDSAVNGEDGFNKLKSNIYDIALVDFLMPVMGGVEMMGVFKKWIESEDDDEDSHVKAETALTKQEIKQRNRNTLIIGMSANALDYNLIEAFCNGMSFFCFKPCDLKMLSLILNSKKKYLHDNNSLISLVIKENMLDTTMKEELKNPNFSLPSDSKCILLGQNQTTIAQIIN